ncbi:MAG: HlyD family efflux transporter periplasmic adaptor subunit [Rhizobiaceae bacterium]
MKIKTAFSLILAAGLVSTSTSALAGNASRAVQEMTLRDRQALPKTKFGIDLMTTGSVRSESNFDARGVVIPNAEVTLGAGIAARIKLMPFKAGEEFRRGESLVVFDCARQNADLRGAKANLTKASSHHRGKIRLKARGAAGAQEVRDAAADMEVAKANVDGLQEVISLCKINAPFNGRVVERHAQTHEIPAANAPILTVVDDSTLEVDLIVPSTWLRWVNKGTRFEFDVDELGRSYVAQVDRLGAKVDAVSQTIKITGKFVERPGNVLTGMSGTAKFDPPTN